MHIRTAATIELTCSIECASIDLHMKSVPVPNTLVSMTEHANCGGILPPKLPVSELNRRDCTALKLHLKCHEPICVTHHEGKYG